MLAVSQQSVFFPTQERILPTQKCGSLKCGALVFIYIYIRAACEPKTIRRQAEGARLGNAGLRRGEVLARARAGAGATPSSTATYTSDATSSPRKFIIFWSGAILF